MFMFGSREKRMAAALAPWILLMLPLALAGCQSASLSSPAGTVNAQAAATLPIKPLPGSSNPVSATASALEQTGEESNLPQTATVELVLAGQSIHTVDVVDRAGKKVLMDAIFNHLIRSAAWPGDDPDTVKNRITIRVQFERDDGYPTVYHVFERDGQHCMQAGQGMYTMINEEVYEPLRELAMGYGLPDTMTVLSGKHEVRAMAVPVDSLGSARGVTPQVMAEYVQYLELDPAHRKETMTPFSPIVGGQKAFGSYTLYNEQFEQMKFIMPSGLEPQTYLFQNAKPGRYIVVLQTTDPTQSDSTRITRQYFFGVIVPENYYTK